MTDFLPPVVGKLSLDISDWVAGFAEADAVAAEFTRNTSSHLDDAVSDFRQAGEEAGRGFSDGLPEGTQETADRVVQNVTGRLRDSRGRFVAEGESAGRAFSDGIPLGTHDAAEGLVRDITGRLRDSRGRFVTEGESAGRGVGEGAASGIRGSSSAVSSAVGDIGSKVRSAFSGLGDVMSAVFSKTTGLAIGIPVAAGALAQLAPVASAAAAALASLPAALTAAAGGMLTLGLGFHGIGSAISAVFQPAMGGASRAINDTAQQERSLEQAQRNSIATQDALNQARKAAAQNIKDLALAMSGAALDEEQATLNVADAEKAYMQAVASHNPDAIYRTNLAYREAEQALAQVQNQSEKTADQAQDADAKGVEGSDQVQQALNAQANAADALANAQDALAKSQQSSAGAASALATAMAGLAPSARAVVQEIQKLKPELTSIQQAVQQHMFAGLAGDLDQLARAWIPGARTGLVGLADDFNKLFRGLAQAASSGETVSALSGLFGGVTKVFGQFAGLAPLVVGAFDKVVAAATPFLTALGSGAVGGLKNLFEWINKIGSNGSLQQFFSAALPVLQALGGTLKDVGGILMAVFNAMGSAGGQALGVIGVLIGQIADFVKSAQGTKVLNEIFSALGKIANAVGGALGQILPVVGDLLSALIPAVMPLIDALTGEFLPIIVDLAKTLGAALVPILQALGPVLGEVADALTPILSLLGGALGQLIKSLAPILAQVATMIGQELVQALHALMPVFTELLPVLVQLVQSLLPALGPLLQLQGQLFAALLPVLVPLINLLVDILVPTIKLLTPLLAMLTPVLGLITQGFIAIITPITTFLAWLIKGLDSVAMWKSVGKFFTDLWHDITKAFDAGVKWISTQWDNMVDRAKAIPHQIVNALGDLGSLLKNGGRDIVTGLWNGIVGMSTWLKNMLTGWVKAVIPGPIAKALGIGSPSKVAAELAQWVPVGIAKGMDDNLSAVTAASMRLAAAMLPGAGNVGGLSLANLTSGPAGGPVMPPLSVGAGQPSRIVVENHVHTHNYLDGKELHAGLIGPSQRYKGRTGVTGLA